MSNLEEPHIQRLIASEKDAVSEIYELVLAACTDGAKGLDLEDFVAIASKHGVYPPVPFAEHHAKEALLLCLGKGWGVGPKATLWDKITVWYAIRFPKGWIRGIGGSRHDG